ncbi:glycosyltransferase 87 family protein [Streptomyces sp. SMC 277]|uniref:Glycosyltransferase 87 family protein n=2 Tax=Streptomyces antimicrobicus TaxID=2883108 RepID=A0ABS8B6S0_9ACTN|nr:glycosyltransferase 87 family protein [Streptomyces antimicrobicus]
MSAFFLLDRFPMVDTLVYRAEGAAVADGTDLYGFRVTEGKLAATYPPFAAILFVPTTWLPVGLLKAAFFAGNVALLALLVVLSWRFAGLPRRKGLMVAAVAAALWLEPVFQTLFFGQVNLALACLILWDLGRDDRAPGKGVALGVAAGIKLTPAVFIVYLLVTGRIKAGLTALAAFAGSVLLGVFVLPGASVDFWTRRLFETDRVGKTWIIDNQSLQGLVTRVLHTTDSGWVWPLAAAVCGGAALWLARRAHLTPGRGDRWGVTITAGTALLVSPISWSHHFVWCVPVIAVLVASGYQRTALAVTVVFASRSLWLVPHQGDMDLHMAWWQQPLASPYAVVTLVLFAAAAWQLRTPAPLTDAAVPRAQPRSAPPEPAGHL